MKFNPTVILLVTTFLMALSHIEFIFDIDFELISVSFVCWISSLLIIGYAYFLASSENSDFLDKEFENEGGDMLGGGESKIVKNAGLIESIFSSIFMAATEEMSKTESGKRKIYNIYYTGAFVFWLPCAWFITGIFLSLLIK